MARFYQIARLVAGRNIFPDQGSLRVDLDGVTPEDLIENDVAFRAAAAPDAWFWLSGGGTLLLNNRYLLVVRRGADARVNPGTFSLFTGRADNAAERADPTLLVRELFEELLLYEDDTLLLPRLPASQPVIDTAYAAMRTAGVIAPGPVRDMPLTAAALPTRPVRIRHQGREREDQLAWTTNANNDVNVLFLFAAECDIGRLAARDGEFQDDGTAMRRAGRHIYLLDTADGAARPLSGGQPAGIPQRDEMSPALRLVVEACSGKFRKPA